MLIKKAGAIIRRTTETGDEILLLYRHKENDWTFPKGHVEAGEDAEMAMRREMKEETGLDVQILKSLPSHFYKSPFEGSIETAMFLAEPTDPSQALQIEHEGDAVRWVPIDEVVTLLSYPNLKEYFQQILAKI